MRRKRSDTMKMPSLGLCIFICTLAIQGATAQRRRATISDSTKLLLPAPSEQSLKELAVAMGAAGYEPFATGTTKPIVKRLIPDNANPDLDGEDYQGVIGKPGVDFPVHPTIPTTNFNCKNVPTGYYADLETDCQVFHICDNGRKISFLCPNGTIFHQSHLICDWWFKVDCASSPASYEESAEHLSQDQKKRKQVNKSLSHHKNSDLQNINADASNINVQNGPSVSNVPNVNAQRVQPPPVNIQRSGTVSKFSFSSQENLSNNEGNSRFRPSKQYDYVPPSNNIKATARSFEVLLPNANNYNNDRYSSHETSASETDNRRKTLIQNTNYRVPTTKSTFLNSYTDANVYRTSSPAPVESNNFRESQVPAESSAFASGTNRQYFNQPNYNNFNTNFKPYPVYSPTPTTRSSKFNLQSTSPTFTTSYVPIVKNRDEYGRAVTSATVNQNIGPHFVTKRPTLVPYVHSTTIARSYTEVKNTKHQPYTRPGVWQLKEHIEKERNKTLSEPSSAATNNAQPSDNPALRLDANQNYEQHQSTIPDDQYNNNAAPSTQYHSSYSETATNFKQYTTEPTYTDRRDRLSKKLELAEDTTEPTTEKFFGRRPGLIVPPSLTPNTLHSLAIYYATALDNLVTTDNPEAEEITTTTEQPEHIAEENKEYLGALLSHHTIEKYSNLFRENSELTNEYQPENNGTDNDLGDDLSASQSQGPLASSPQIRELAQVFTHALSAYLQDPEQFRKVLSEIRPTEPSFGELSMTTENSGLVEYTNNDNGFDTITTIQDDGDDEILGFSDDNKSSHYSQIRESFTPSYPPVIVDNSSLPDTVTESATTASVYYNQDTSEYETPKIKSLSQTRGSYYSFCCGGNRLTSPKYQQTSTTTESTDSINYDERQGRLNRFQTNDNTSNVNGHSSYFPDKTENLSVPRYGGFQNNSASSYSPYGQGVQPNGATPIAGNNYEIPDSVPTHWGSSETNTTVNLKLRVPSTDIEPPANYEGLNDSNTGFNAEIAGNTNEDSARTTQYPTTTSEPKIVNQQFNSHFVTPQTADDNPEIENEEQLQRAHSQSFLSPQNSFDRHSKNTEVGPNGKYVDNNEYTSKSNATFRVRTSTGDSLSVHTTKKYSYSTTDHTERPSYESTSNRNEEPAITISSTPVVELTTVTYDAPVFNKESGNTFQWSNSFDNWHSTAVLDPITLNEGLSNDDNEQISSASTVSHTSNGRTTAWDETLSPVYVQSTTPTPDSSRIEYYTTSDQQSASQQTNDAYTYGTPSTYAPPANASRLKIVEEAYKNNSSDSARYGKALSDVSESSSELDDNMMEKAKEVLGELNVTNSDSLVNVMKKTKSNTMRRLILLLVQTCDDDHNKTAEASKKALLEALMTLSRRENPTTTTTETQTESVPQYTDDIEAQRTTNVLTRITNTHRRMDTQSADASSFSNEKSDFTNESDRRGKRLRFDHNAINAINALTDVTSTLAPITHAPEITDTPTPFARKSEDSFETSTTLAPSSLKPVTGRRGVRKFLVRTSPVDKISTTSTSAPIAEARIAETKDISKNPSDTRALELLRSLYTIAARWG